MGGGGGGEVYDVDRKNPSLEITVISTSRQAS